MKLPALFCTVAIIALLTACSSTPEQVKSTEVGDESNTSASANSDSQVMYLEDLPPDFQLWPDGVTFNDSTRLVVVHARSLGLQMVVDRARAIYGPDLTGMVNVRMIIQPDGSVSSVDLLDDQWSDSRAAELTDSVLYLIEQWTFPPGLERPLSLEQPFKFNPPPEAELK